MSRIGKRAVEIPSGVKVEFSGRHMKVNGPKGKLELEVHPRMKVDVKEKEISVQRPTDIRTDRSLHGLTRSLIQNMVVGVTEGFKKELGIEGVGFKAQVKGKMISLALGYTHPVEYDIPEGVEVKCPSPTSIHISGADKQKVGQVAADIRKFHEPEPYKGKGVFYVGEHIRRKQGKTVG